MKEIQSDLGRLKKGIDEAKTDSAKLEGRKQEQLNQLKTEFNLDTIEEAEKKLEELNKQLDAKKADIENEYKKLKEEYDW